MRARVWNNGDKEYKEMFRGDEIKIPARGFIEMDAKDANFFRGQFTPIIKDGQGRDLHPKPLSVEILADTIPAVEAAPKFVCQMDGTEWPSQAALDKHIMTNWSDSLIEPDAKENLQKKMQTRK
jgi:hypothetical protein